MESCLSMTVIDGFLAICLSAHMAKTNKEVRATIKRVIKKVPKSERYKFESFLLAHNPRAAIQTALTALVQQNDI